jgi:hypothetical protein
MSTGCGGNLIVVNDLLKAAEAWSKTSRESANRFFDSSLTPRRNNPSQDAFLIVQQRLHEDDLVGHTQAINWPECGSGAVITWIKPTTKSTKART